MYYRRKILLSFLELSNNKLEKIRLHKLLLIFSESQKNRSFNFVPNKYGCYSFQANADLNTMKKYGMVNESDFFWYKIDSEKYFNKLNEDDKNLINEVLTNFGKLSTKDLVKYTYLSYPFYAVNSIVADQLLFDVELQIIKNQQQTLIDSQNEKTLFTIGYEGLSIEQYLNKLIIHNVKVLCDVRCNPVSMKYGFSKNQLIKSCSSIGIKYFHFPELGIVSGKRNSLETQNDYNILFEDYKSTTLKKELSKQKSILNLIEQYNKVALTCFEADINRCHRSHLAESLSNFDEMNYKLIHL